MSRNYGSQFTLENMLCNKRGHRNAKPMDLNQSNRPSPQLVKKPHKAMKTQDSQKKKFPTACQKGSRKVQVPFANGVHEVMLRDTSLRTELFHSP